VLSYLHFANYEFSQNLYSFTCFFSITIAISLLLFGVAQTFSDDEFTIEATSEYECGFAPFDDSTRQPFSVHYFIVCILFLIFDIEILVLIPWVLKIESYGLFGFFMMILFLLILTVGFIYE